MVVSVVCPRWSRGVGGYGGSIRTGRDRVKLFVPVRIVDIGILRKWGVNTFALPSTALGTLSFPWRGFLLALVDVLFAAVAKGALASALRFLTSLF